MTLGELEHPIIQAPMGGGPSTPELAVAVGEAGGLGFLAAGYKSTAALEAEIEAVRALSDVPFGVNLFAPSAPAAPDAYAPYVARLAATAERYGTSPGTPRHGDDEWGPKLELLSRAGIAAVSVTFGCPDTGTVRSLHEAGSEVWITVTDPEEAEAAAGAGADALIVQGIEAGAHQGSFDDTAEADFGLLALLQLVSACVEVPLIGAGGIATGAGMAAALAAGASAVQIGTAFMLAPEAGTTGLQRSELRRRAPTAMTRAFTGRRARGIANRFMEEHADAPSAYPEIHYATAPIRAAAREAGDRDGLNLWAGQAHELAREMPAAEIVKTLVEEAGLASARVERLLDPPTSRRAHD
jgi:nitronate monooxygenase